MMHTMSRDGHHEYQIGIEICTVMIHRPTLLEKIFGNQDQGTDRRDDEYG